jgi:hypothetical protein
MLDPAARPPARGLRALALLAIVAGPALAAEPTPVAVEAGRAEFDVVTTGPGSKALVVVSALAREAGPFAIALDATSKAAAEARPLPMTADPSGPGAPGPARPIAAAPPVSAMPPWPSRRFSLLVRDGDVASASNYLGVEARLAAVGARVQVYVDARDEGSLAPGFVEEVVATFDERVFPLAERRFGTAADVDGDGRFTIFVSSWLTRLAGGRYKVDGFVRGADFDRSVDTPFGNRSDMMYLSAALRPGPHLKTVLAHEYTHAVVFSRRAFPDGLNGRPRPEEEGWLDEGLAHLVEDAHGFSRTNLDYRVSAFLSRPEKYRLVVEDYYAADLFRSHGNRGGAYLFLRWCVDRHGEGVLDRMIRSDLRGVANLEAATGRSFTALYREWTTALFLSGLDPSADPAPTGQYRSLDPRGTIEDWVLAGPRSSRVRPDGPADTWSAAGTSTHYVVVDGSDKGAVHVKVEGPPEARLQVTVVPLPDDLGGLDLDVRATPGGDGAVAVRARVASRGSTPVRLGAIAWEPLVPPADARDQVFRRSGLDMLGIARRFGTSALGVGGKLASGPIRLEGVRPGDGPLVFKAVGTDAAGHRVAAWAEVEIRPDDVEFGVGDGS